MNQRYRRVMNQSEIGKLHEKRRPQSLVNLEKGKSFKSSVEFFRDWKKLSEQEKKDITPTEKIGIYGIVFSMFEDRLETLWWNCSYVYKWNVIGEREWNEEEQRYVIVGRKPPDEKEFKKRKIPRGIRHTGYFRSSLLENKKISQKLDDRIEKSESDRRELIHRFMYFQKDLMDKHIIDVMELFREIDKLIQKHKRVNKNLL